jgi:phosphoribosylanthranilate isomerase
MNPAARVKICGMRNTEDIVMAVSCGADSVGFITEVPVPTPRKLDLQTAAGLIGQVPSSV